MGSSRNRGIPVTPEKLVFIEHKMREKGIDSQEKLAELASLSTDVIKKLFKGKDVDKSTIRAVSNTLEIEPTEIVEVNRWHPQPTTERSEASRNIDWQKICRDVLKHQRKQFLTSYPLGAADRRVRDVYVPLGLIERQEKPRVEQDLDPENWSIQKQEETIKPVSHEDFFESVLKGQSPKSKGKRIAIIGEPGAGKTTLLQEICSKVDGVTIWIDLASLKKGDVLEDYLLEKWLKSSLTVIRKYAPTVVPNLLEPSTELKEAFTNLFDQNEVWLLLDGADEMASELRDPLNWVAQGLYQNPGWVANARVVLSSRLNTWNNYGDRLSGEFDVYRNLDFEPEDVSKFIDKWFIEEPSSSKNLNAALENSSDRMRSLIRNPLRLTLLCLTWKGLGDRLPETKAGLYRRLVKAHHKWKNDNEEFSMEAAQLELLHQKLGELSKDALDSKDSRFRLRESYIVEFLGKPDQEHSLFWWAIKLGWLNPIGLPSADENDADEPIYAFLHPTFQEYFAALAINDWNDFLPYLHEDKPIVQGKESLYRFFNPKYKEVLSLWLGRDDIENNLKNSLIKKALTFNDSCHGFYWKRSILLLTENISEIQITEIYYTICLSIELAFGVDIVKKTFSRLDKTEKTKEDARLILKNIDPQLIIPILESVFELIEDLYKDMLDFNTFNYIRHDISDYMLQIEPDNISAAIFFLEVANSKDNVGARRAIESLSNFRSDNSEINLLLSRHIIDYHLYKDEEHTLAALKCLSSFSKNSSEVIKILNDIIDSTTDLSTRMILEICSTLGSISVDVLGTGQRVIAILLRETKGPARYAIDTLSNLLAQEPRLISELELLLNEKSYSDEIMCDVSVSILKAQKDNKKAQTVLLELLSNGLSNLKKEIDGNHFWFRESGMFCKFFYPMYGSNSLTETMCLFISHCFLEVGFNREKAIESLELLAQYGKDHIVPAHAAELLLKYNSRNLIAIKRLILEIKINACPFCINLLPEIKDDSLKRLVTDHLIQIANNEKVKYPTLT